MLPCYHEIIEKFGREPDWWTEDGFPRYVQFRPEECGIYAMQVALLQIECQSCGHRFNVVREWSPTGLDDTPPISKTPNAIGYGDPPNLPCCASGPTMQSDTIRILEFWSRVDIWEWKRIPAIEATVFE